MLAGEKSIAFLIHYQSEVRIVEKILVYLVGLLGGVAVGIQSPIAGKMGQRVGGTAGSFIVHLGGLIFSGLLLIFRGGETFAIGTNSPGTCSSQAHLVSFFT